MRPKVCTSFRGCAGVFNACAGQLRAQPSEFADHTHTVTHSTVRTVNSCCCTYITLAYLASMYAGRYSWRKLEVGRQSSPVLLGKAPSSHFPSSERDDGDNKSASMVLFLARETINRPLQSPILVL
jgi:hypothetical protein